MLVLGVSKLANTLFANTLARRLSSAGIISLSLHPGLVNTSLATRFSFPRLTNLLMSVVATEPDTGAYTSCFAAASPIVRKEAEKYNGTYLTPPQKITAPSGNALNIALQDQLWETTEEYLKGQALGPD
jgi:NAD(P)-dependent dehydrogenase (short-subunit alcohol dehydrogenase family)